MYDTILVPTDGSDGTDAVLDHALHLAGSEDATVHALSVMDETRYFTTDDDLWEALRESARRDCEAAVAHVEERGADAGVEVVGAIEEGTPARNVVGYAEEADIDLVIMGTHGRTGRDRLANLGSVTERVVRNADAPVLVVGIGDE